MFLPFCQLNILLINVEIKKESRLKKKHAIEKTHAIENSTEKCGVLEKQKNIKIIEMSGLVTTYVSRISVAKKKKFSSYISQFSEFMSTLV